MKMDNHSGYSWIMLLCIATVLSSCSDDGSVHPQQIIAGGCEPGLHACGADCYNLKIDSSHCGNCETICINQVCVNGSCVDADKACTDSALNYCDGQCVNLQTDSKHCGDCKTVCKSNETCSKGNCKVGCAPNYKLCDNACYNVAQDNEHCGDCNTSCHSTMYCMNAHCNCQYGLYDCDNDAENGCESSSPCESACDDESFTKCGAECFDLQNDAKHCGNCQTKCNPSQICSDGSCTESDKTCDSDDQISCWGECVDKNDVAHCGSCENACKSDQNCINGKCENKSTPSTCELPKTICYGRCVDLSSDDMNCGRCLNECPPNHKCVNSTCELQCAPRTNCNGTCIDTTSDASHCGDCNTSCLAGQRCTDSRCECDANHYNCDGDDANGCESTEPCTCTPGETEPCWRGASVVFKSEFDKSICEKGSRTCDESGQFWGPCTGGVYPSTLSCDIYGNLNGLDNDCNGEIDTICKSECDLAAGDMSYIGCEYWGAYIDNLIKNANSNHTFVLSNPNDAPADIYIYDKEQATNSSATPVKTETIAAHDVVAIEMHNTGYNMCQGSGILPNAYRIRASLPITAYQFSPLGNPNAHSNDASLLLPANVLGKKYIGMTWRSEAGNDHRSYIAIIATEPGTTKVKFTTTSDILATETATITTESGQVTQTTTPKLEKGDTHDFELNRFDVLTLMAPADDSHNQTGSLITADKNIVVFGGSRASYVPTTGLCCRDHIEEQLFPTQAWGKSYLAARAYSGGVAGDFWVITARDDNTTIQLTKNLKNLNNGNADIPETITLNAGETYPAFETRTPFEIHADKPISVGQFLPSQAYNKYTNPDDPSQQIGDPSFILTVPYEQYRSDYDFMVPTEFNTNYITIIAPQSATITYDGSTIAESDYIGTREQIGDSHFYVGYIQVQPGVHHMTADQPFGLYSYGYYNMSSYGYPIGLDLKIINTN